MIKLIWLKTIQEREPVAAINLYEKWYYAIHFIYFQGF